jgi:hypothetical protein
MIGCGRMSDGGGVVSERITGLTTNVELGCAL